MYHKSKENNRSSLRKMSNVAVNPHTPCTGPSTAVATQRSFPNVFNFRFVSSQKLKDFVMSFQLPALSYDYSHLEPYIDATTMNIHHTKHHQAYVTKLNEAMQVLFLTLTVASMPNVGDFLAFRETRRTLFPSIRLPALPLQLLETTVDFHLTYYVEPFDNL
jgi:hypothetical protein